MSAATEFDIIQRYFSFSDALHLNSPNGADAGFAAAPLLGIGDDAAVLPAAHLPQIVATDTLIEGVHFPERFAAEHVASRAIGVNLSDFAAMGARPLWMTMALSLPDVDEDWLVAFSRSLAAECERYKVQLIGGDTTKGALSLSLTVIGHPGAIENSDEPLWLTRNGARAGDDIWVSGSLGKGAGALALLTDTESGDWSERANADELEALRTSFYAPLPRLALGEGLLPLASAAIDISDGLLADAGHIAEQSQVQLVIDSKRLPVDVALSAYKDQHKVMDWVFGGGDEYELLFCASPDNRSAIKALADRLLLACTRIGSVVDGAGVAVLGDCERGDDGYRHF